MASSTSLDTRAHSSSKLIVLYINVETMSARLNIRVVREAVDEFISLGLKFDLRELGLYLLDG